MEQGSKRLVYVLLLSGVALAVSILLVLLQLVPPLEHAVYG